MEISGKIIVVQEPKTGTSSKTGNPWMMQEYVIEIPGIYPRHFAFTVFGEDRIKQLDIKNGEDLTVQFEIDAREHNGKWYNDFKAYNIVRGQLIPQPVHQVIPNKGEDLPFLPPSTNSDEQLFTNDGSGLPF